MIFQTESALAEFAENLGKNLGLPAVFELIGDVGAGKTTFTRALARGLGVSEPVTSPSFAISKRYDFSYVKASGDSSETLNASLVHYDFYRLDDPGIMSLELAETLSDPNSVVVIEWGDSVSSLLPSSRTTIFFKVLPDGSRELTFGDKK